MSDRTRARALLLLRSFKGMTQQELAERAGVSKATISACESGKQEIGPSNLLQVLASLELPFRAWCETVSYVERLEWLGSRFGQPIRRPVDFPTLQRNADTLAEAFGRDRERQAAGLLDFALDLLMHLEVVREG